MTTPIVDVDVFTDPLLTQDDGEDVDATVMLSINQPIANRTRRLMNIAEGVSDVQTPRTVVRVVSASWLVPTLNPGAIVQWETDGSEGWSAVAAIVGELRGSMNDLLPEGATIIRLRAMVTSAFARVGASRMGFELKRVTYGLPVAPAVTPATDGTASLFATFDNAAAEQQMIDSGVISELIAKATTDLVVFVRSGLGSGVGDDVHAIEITFTDPGRRW